MTESSTTPGGNGQGADEAAALREAAAAAGTPIQPPKGFKRGKGRPRKEPTVEEVEAWDQARCKQMMDTMLGDATTAPAEMGETFLGEHWKIPPERKQALGQAADMWIRNRLKMNLKGGYAFDILLLGLLLLTYAKPIIFEIQFARIKRAKRVDNNPGHEVDGKNDPGSAPAIGAP